MSEDRCTSCDALLTYENTAVLECLHDLCVSCHTKAEKCSICHCIKCDDVLITENTVVMECKHRLCVSCHTKSKRCSICKYCAACDDLLTDNNTVILECPCGLCTWCYEPCILEAARCPTCRHPIKIVPKNDPSNKIGFHQQT